MAKKRVTTQMQTQTDEMMDDLNLLREDSFGKVSKPIVGAIELVDSDDEESESDIRQERKLTVEEELLLST